MDRWPQAPGNWSRFGWQADHLDLFDLCSTGWQTDLLTRSILLVADKPQPPQSARSPVN